MLHQFLSHILLHLLTTTPHLISSLLNLPHTQQPNTKAARAKESIAITAKLKVDKIELITSIPSTWTESVAYLVDVMDMGNEPTKPSSETLSLDAYIHAEDQESWGGSLGHAQGDTHVFGLNDGDPDEKTWCCDCEHFEPDENAMQELWSHELLANESDIPSRDLQSMGNIILLVHPKVGLKKCSYLDVINGKIIPAKIIRRKCPTEMIIFVPVDKEIRKAVIILRNPHNHPMHPRTKPSFKDKKKITKAIHAAGTTGLTVSKLMNVPSLIVDQQLAPSTTLVYDGSSIADHSLPYMNQHRLHDKIQEEKLKEYPKGMGWDGYIHIVLYLYIDYTFKWVTGELNAWDVVRFLDRLNCWIIFATLFCDRATREAFLQLFTEFADMVTQVTGSILKLCAFFPDGSLRCIILDAEAAQILGLVSAEVIKQLKGFVGLASQSEIDEWHAFCCSVDDESVQSIDTIIFWIFNKIQHEWYLPSLNRLLSSIDQESWDLTPNHSNLAETAHAARNAETSIGVPVLTAVLQVHEWDNAKAKEIELMEKSDNMPCQWNGPDKQELLQAQRQAWGLYNELQEERQIGIEQNKESLGQQKLDRIGIDIKGEQELCRKWRSCQKDIDDEVQELKTDSYSESQLGVDGVASPEGCPEPTAQEVEFIQDNLNGEDRHLLTADIEPETAADAHEMDDLALLDINFSFADVHDLDFGTIDMETPAQSLEQPTDWNMSYY
ncbi:hypothetical protein L208DRAFT_1503629 [Tricholoma matsutake]|nr:hypothetical protein L208DRAFT_1503629 [Tricholoma matsutake 945]